jgi:C1A family cysteine protease
VSTKYATGWRRDKEDIASLTAKARTFSAPQLMADAPDEVDHRAWMTVWNQLQLGSCTGHAESEVLELCEFIKSGGNVVQFCRMFCYIAGQMESGMLGSDQGATIEGVVDATVKKGVCLESTWPYTGKYTTQIPQAALTEAAPHTLNTHTILNTYTAIFNWIAAGNGGVIIGIDCVQAIFDCTGVLDKLYGKSEGGHALALLGYSKRVDSSGRKYIWLLNSWGTSWGNKGWAEIAPSVIDQWCQSGEVMIGVSDLQTYGVRPIPTWKGMLV